MPKIKSAKKALRQNIRRRISNERKKDELKNVIKKYRKLVISSKNEAQEYLPQVYKKVDKAVKIKLIKKNKGARIKSRLTKLLK